MAFIEQIADSEFFERDRAALGFVPNYTKLFAHRPAVVRGVARSQGRDPHFDGHAPLRARDARGGPPPPLQLLPTWSSTTGFSKTLDALGAQADPAYAGLDPELRDVLTVGRPIAEA